MTDEKTTKELMKALIDFLRAKTKESISDNEFTRSILLDESEIKFEEDQSWSQEFKRVELSMSNNNLCLSCHQEHESGYAFCEVCLPWCVKDKDADLELLPKLEELSIIEFLENPEFELLSLLSRPQNEVDWGISTGLRISTRFKLR